MKRILAVLVSMVAVMAFAVPAQAKPAVDTCSYIQDGSLFYPAGHFLTTPYSTGYDIFGYNYQAHMFNGTYGNAYFGRDGQSPYLGDDTAYLASYPSAAAHWAWPFRNVQLQMKWNDAWLANRDCTEDGRLDRSTPYQGSGAWLTNHATGTYTSTLQFSWNTTGSYIFDYEWNAAHYPNDVVLTQSGSAVTGTIGWPAGADPYTVTGTVDGSVTGDQVTLTVAYSDRPYLRTMTGTIASDGSISGSWTDANLAADHGTWSTVPGVAVKVFDTTCTVSDFVKIVAPPAGATKTAGVWYTAAGDEIGPDIWGEFAIIQEQSSDPCGEYGVINYMSPLKKGLGNW